jgi:hypothetical protein
MEYQVLVREGEEGEERLVRGETGRGGERTRRRGPCRKDFS